MADRLRPLWDFDDLDASERRLRSQLERETTDAGRAEVLTQLARVEGLRGDFDRCAQLLAEAEPLAGQGAPANVRLDLERGRMYRSGGDSQSALPLFQRAFARAVDASEHYLAGDAAHMCAISSDGRDVMEDWTQRGLDLGEREPDASYWAGPLLNNLGWSYFDDAEYDHALQLFERALAARKRDVGNVAGIAWAQYAVGRTLRMLGRDRDALPLLESAASALPSATEVGVALSACREAT
jgi:tetratricopeptide (TPR) repeat protein